MSLKKKGRKRRGGGGRKRGRGGWKGEREGGRAVISLFRNLYGHAQAQRRHSTGKYRESPNSGQIGSLVSFAGQKLCVKTSRNK